MKSGAPSTERLLRYQTSEYETQRQLRFQLLHPGCFARKLRQAKRVRRFGSRNWKNVSGDRIDPSRAYLSLR